MKEKLLEIIKIVISMIIGLFILNKKNIFSYATWIPKDKVFDIGLITYLPSVQIFLDWLFEVIKENFISKLSVTLFSPNSEPSLDSNAIIDFKNNDLAEIRIRVELNGKYKHFKNIKVVFPNITSLTMQPKKDIAIAISDKEECVIYLNEIIGSERKDINFKYEYILNFIKDEELNPKGETEFYPEFKIDTYRYKFLKKFFWLNGKFLIRYHNKAKIKWGE